MKVFKLVLLMSIIFGTNELDAQLGQYRWENRIILIFGSASKEAQVQEQLQLVGEHTKELEDRNLLVFYFVDNLGQQLKGKKQWSAKQVLELRKRYDIPKDTFEVLLIGKDGGVKRRSSNLLEPKDFFDLIDSMPMRQMEMRRKKG